MDRRNWTRNELIVAFNLYCRIPFGRIHNKNPEIIELATALGRTPSAVSWKLANFSRLDPTIHSRNLKGASHGAKLEHEIWNEFNQDWDSLVSESERIRRELLGIEDPQNDDETTQQVLPPGGTRIAQIMARVNQSFFRSAVLAAYESSAASQV